MGSSSSRLRSRPFPPRVNRPARRLSSFICGGSSSQSPVEMEDAAETLVKFEEDCDPLYDQLHSQMKDSFSFAGLGTGFTISEPETGASSESVTAYESTDVEDASRNVGRIQDKLLYESRELVPHQHPNAESGLANSCGHTVFATSSRQNSAESASAAGACRSSGSGNSVSHSTCEVVYPSSISPNQGVTDGNHAYAAGNSQNPGSYTDPVTSYSLVGVHLQNESYHGTTLPEAAFLVTDRELEHSDRRVVQGDVVSTSSTPSSSTADMSNREARRNSRRLFSDALSRSRSRRQSDSSALHFPTDDTDSLGSHDRWLLDFGGDFLGDGVGNDSARLNARIHNTNERRSRSRSEIWERLRGGLTETGRRTTVCPSGLHPDGVCSCESLSTAGHSGTRASISRIVMLAEALFEVLDEIHRQPVPFSLSMSLPAPESLVDSFPIKSHKRPETVMTRDDVEQCYICLAEYEDGDNIRILPCRHEYHMLCVDKWLKEIHGVCPLCRGDVREAS